MAQVCVEWDLLPQDLKLNLVRLMNDSNSLSIAANDLNVDVRIAVTINHSTSEDTLLSLAENDENVLVKKLARTAIEGLDVKSPF